MAFSREFIFPERERDPRRESFQEGGLQYLNSAFSHLPNGGLDQLDPMLGSGCCFVSPPNQ